MISDTMVSDKGKFSSNYRHITCVGVLVYTYDHYIERKSANYPTD